ncbi:hypothetical protein FIV36_05185 [Pseudomonas extremaustralis]|uniref:Uncharacterized protein n=1 Tax=Pseudomonas extremaustralis TaxID=359110 RepID=A0A5C5QN64_9PSED|nr:hypothetical protein FIV36_05185 [Pseudomonas extremaustralis]
MPSQSEIQPSVGASLLAKIANDNAHSWVERGVLEFFANKPTPTEGPSAAWANTCNPHNFQRKTSNPGAHLVQSQPL